MDSDNVELGSPLPHHGGVLLFILCQSYFSSGSSRFRTLARQSTYILVGGGPLTVSLTLSPLADTQQSAPDARTA